MPGRTRRAAPVAAIMAGLAATATAIAGMATSLADGSLLAVPPGASPAMVGPARLAQLNGLIARRGTDPAIARGAAAADPLAWQPFYVAASAPGRSRAALLAAALRRDPRSIIVRIALLERAAAAGDGRGALDQLVAVRRLDLPVADGLIARLAAAATTPAQVEQIAADLQARPALFLPFLRSFVAAGKPAPLVLAFSRQLPVPVLRDAAVGDILIGQLVAAGRYKSAFALWRLRHPVDGRSAVRDGSFAESTLPPPFGWQLQQGAAGVAERVAGGGLDLIAYGHESGVLVGQTLLLSPGRHILTLRYRATAGDTSLLSARLRCAGDGRILAAAPLTSAPGLRIVPLAATVPAGTCQGQLLEIVAAFGVGQTAQQVHLAQVGAEPQP